MRVSWPSQLQGFSYGQVLAKMHIGVIDHTQNTG